MTILEAGCRNFGDWCVENEESRSGTAHGYYGGSEEGEVNHLIDASVTAESVGALVSKRSKSAARRRLSRHSLCGAMIDR